MTGVQTCALPIYAGGYVAQFIRNYQTWESAGNFAGNGTAPQIPSPHPLACLDALTAFPYNLYGIFLCLAAFGLLTFLLMRMGFDRNGEITDRGRNLNYSTKGTYGTSGFMTLEEMHQVLELTNDVKKHKGTILGKLNGKAVCLPKDTRMNRNIAVYGASGSMKSRAFARGIAFANELMPGWTGQPVAERLSASLGLPVAVLNDVKAHALGEARWGAARGAQTCFVIAAGTGLGGGIVANGRVLLGAHGFAGELGRTPCPDALGTPRACGTASELESIAAGSGIEARYVAAGGERLAGDEIARRAADGEELARRIILEAGAVLGEAIATWTDLLDPELVVLSGSVCNAGKAWRAALQEGFERQAPSVMHGLPIVDAALGSRAPLIGAAEYLLDTSASVTMVRCVSQPRARASASVVSLSAASSKTRPRSSNILPTLVNLVRWPERSNSTTSSSSSSFCMV